MMQSFTRNGFWENVPRLYACYPYAVILYMALHPRVYACDRNRQLQGISPAVTRNACDESNAEQLIAKCTMWTQPVYRYQ